MENLSGTSIKGYELRERIGAGGFGAVYRAYQSSIGREVAVKIILPHFAAHPDFIRRFETEAQLVARLEHPHIIPLYDYWRDSSGAYLVMRWLHSSLHDALKDSPFSLSSAALLLDQVASALALAHRNSIIHRDLKPANILLDEDGNAYVADFGIAKDLGNLQVHTTQADVVVGSPDYLSPEQARSEIVSPRTDIYSLGVLLYEVLTGQHPFPNLTPVERMFKHLNDPLPALTNLPSDVAAGLNAVIQQATAKNPADRYLDVLAMAAAFQEAAGLRRERNGASVVEALTQREQEVLQRIIAGQSNKQIAQELFITIQTVKWYVRQIFGKLGVRSRVQAIVRARELKLIVQGDAAPQQIPIPTDQFAPENPYKGLCAFQAADCQDFFGRETLLEKLIKRLNEPSDMARFLAVVGPSGSGKSSLVKAGLIPALWRGALPGSERWFVVEMLPSAHPIDELEVALTRVAAAQSGNLREQLERDDRGLLRVAQLILPNDGSQLVLVIDQFEEVFTLVEDEQSRVHFLNLIREAVGDPRSRVRIVITLRADFYDRPLLYPEFGELVRSRMETVLPLTADGLERAIARPAERVGAKFEPGLVASIVSEVNYQPGALPLLQYALTELFERRQGRILTREAYQAIGGTVGALARQADEIYEGLDSEGQEAARQMFLRLVTLGEGVEDTRRRVPRSELLAIAADEDTMDDLIDTYAVYRLLSLDHDPVTRRPTVEVAHEAILREWQRLRAWLNESRHDIRMQRLLAVATAEWLHAKRDDSFLLRGSRLDQFQTWSTDTKLALTQKERDYLDASLADRERQTLMEQKRQAREKTLEQRSRNFLRGLVAVLVVAALVGFGLAAVAITQSQMAQQNAAESQTVALVAGSQVALTNGNTDLAIALSLRAATLDPTSALAQVALGQAAYAPGTIRRFVGHSDAVPMAAFSPDGRTIISGSLDKTLILWDVQTGHIVRRFEGDSGGVTALAMSQDGRTALSGSEDKTLILWDVQTGHIIRHFEGHTASVDAVAFSPDGLTILSGSLDKTLILWDVQTSRIIRRFGANDEGHHAAVTSVVFSPDGRTALSGSQEDLLILWNITTGDVIQRIKTDQEWDESVVFSPDGRTALSGGGDNTLVEIDVHTGQIIRRLLRHDPSFNGGILHVIFSHDGRTALTSAADHTLRLWDLNEGQILRRFAAGNQAKLWTADVRFSPDGRTALSGGWDGRAILWDVQTGQALHQITGAGQVFSTTYSADGRTALITTGGLADTPSDVIVWDLVTGREIRRLKGHPSGVMYAVFSPDGRIALSGGMKGFIILWDVATGQEIRRLTGYENDSPLPQDDSSCANFSPDGRTVMTGFGRGLIVLWDVATGQEIRRLTGHTHMVNDTIFSSDGRTVLSSSWDKTVIVWDVATGTILKRLVDANSSVFKVAFSPDERLAFAGSADGTSLLWDLKTGQVIRRYTGRNANAFSAGFSPDGHSIFLGFQNGEVQLWRVDSQEELTTWTYANRYIPELDCTQRKLYRLTPACDASGAFPTSTAFPTTAPPATAAPTQH